MNSAFTINKVLVDNPWFILEEGFDPIREREVETILSLGNGHVGTRNSLEEEYIISNPGTFVAGIYEHLAGKSYNELAKIPNWTRIEIYVDNNILDLFDEGLLEHRRYLDLKQGVSIREWKSRDSVGRITNIMILKYISLYDKHELGKSLIIRPENYSGQIKVRSGIDGSSSEYADLIHEINYSQDLITYGVRTKVTDRYVAITQRSEFIKNYNLVQQKDYVQAGISYGKEIESQELYEIWEWNAEIESAYMINSLAALYSNIEIEKPQEASRNHLINLDDNFMKTSLANHTSMWKDILGVAQVIVSNDLEAQRWINFALYHLIISGKFTGDYFSIPARNLSGESYKGHVFWDTEIYLLPFFIFTQPQVARSLLMYRYNTLNGARENAFKEGFIGACYPWESTDSGAEMAPSKVRLPNGEEIQIYSGKYENHISPDIAYAVWQYWLVTHDDDFIVNYGAEIIFETARFCKSLFIRDNDGLYHIYNVIGPDEYHEKVNDNAYTNFMVQENFIIAFKVINLMEKQYSEQLTNLKKQIKLEDKEIAEWSEIADKIYVSYDPKVKIYEQFQGYFDLEYINLEEYEPRTAPMDIILGRQRTNNSQVIKQPDVIMFLFLLANKFPKNVIETNFDYYEPRTGHGSSLSPGIYSIIASRLGKKELAYKYFKQNATIDLNNNMGNAAGGIHIASQGSLWMSVIMGFAGMYIYDEGLLFDPHIPDDWGKLEFSLFWRSQKITVKIFENEIILDIDGDKSVLISVGPDNWSELKPKSSYLAKKDLSRKWIWR